MRFSTKAVATGLRFIILLLVFSPAVAENALPEPAVQFSFDADDSRLQIESGKVELVDGGVSGRALKVGDPRNKIFWQVPSSGLDWSKGTASFWFKPLDWDQLESWRTWLNASSVGKPGAMNFVVSNFVKGHLFCQIKDLKNIKTHIWSGFNGWENGQWYFATVTWGPETGAVYFNGECNRAIGGFRQIPHLAISSGLLEGARMYIGTQGMWQKKYALNETSLMDELQFRQEQLSDEQVRRLYYMQKPAKTTAKAVEIELPISQPPRMIIPIDASAPQIDGLVKDAEWADATRFIGLANGDTGFLTDREFAGYLKSDGEKLYFAFKMKIHSSEILIRDNTERDSDVFLDDSWEFYLYPEAGEGNYYQLVVNSLGVIFDQYGRDRAWNGNWEVKQNFGAREIGSPNLWEAEVAIAWDDLAQTEDIEKAPVYFGFFVNQKKPEIASLGWTSQTGLFNKQDRAAVLRFEKDQSLVRIKSLGAPNIGIVSPVIEFAGKGQKVFVSLQMSNGDKIDKIIEESGSQVHFPPMQGRGKALLTIISPPDATPAQADFHYLALLEYDSIPVVLKTVNYPSREQLCLEINYGAFEAQADVKQYIVDFGKVSIPASRNSKIPWEKVYVSTSDMAPGQYQGQVSLLDADGKKLTTQKFEYTKEGNEPWRNNKIGIIAGHVPTPYTPIEIKGRTIGVIDRQITLAQTGLPERINSKGIDLLAEPVKLQGIFNGQKDYLKATKPFEYETIATDDSIGTAKVAIGPLSGILKQTVSFDGFCWYEIDLSSDKKFVAEGMAIEIQLSKDLAKSYQLAGVDFKKTKLELEEAIGDVLTKDMSLGFTGQVWLGNTKAGFSWLAETHKGWQVANDTKVIEIIRQEDSTLLRINIVDEAIELTGEFKLAFGLQPTPVKPITQRVQRFIWCSGRYVDTLPKAEAFGVYRGQNEGSLYGSYVGLPEPAKAELCLKEVEKQIKAGFNPTPYSVITWLSLGLDEMKTYKGDWYLGQPWSSTAGQRANPEPYGICDVENKEFQDFLIWRFIKNWSAYGGTSVYYDLYSPIQNTSPKHKKGYVTRTGQTVYPWEIRAVREIARRLYLAYRQKNPDFVVFTNAGGGFWTPLMAFSDASCGQHTEHVYEYPKILTYDRYRSCFLGAPIGVKQLFLPNLKSPVLVARMELSHYLAGIVFSHNTAMWFRFCDRSAVNPYFRVYHGKSDWPVQEFFSYWEYPNLTNLNPEKFKVSGWYNAEENKGLLCIASLNVEAVTAPVGLAKDWKYKELTNLADACKESLEGWEKTYPSGKTVLIGDYTYYLNAGKLGAVYDEENGVVTFKPYGLIMLHVKQ